MKIADVAKTMNNELRHALTGMLSRDSMTEETLVDDFLAAWPAKRTTDDQNEGLALCMIIGYKSRIEYGKFAPKLTFEDRCAILGLNRLFYPKDTIAKAFGVDRRTVSHVISATGGKYRSIKEQEKRLGKEKFIAQYVTSEIMGRIRGTQEQKVSPETPRKSANARAGAHQMQNEMCSFRHSVIVSWRDDQNTPGWYYKDLDGDFPDSWFHSHDLTSIKTSQACFNAAQQEISDKLT